MDRRGIDQERAGSSVESGHRQGGRRMSLNIRLVVNGKRHSAKIDPVTSLLDFLRDTLGYKGVKLCCNTGECGACTILLNGKPVNSCVVLAADAAGAQIVTVEGLAEGDKQIGRAH